MTPPYTAVDYLKHREWVAQHGGVLFPTVGSFEWFIRQHRDQLIASGELIVRRGPGGTLVGPGFGRLAVAIIQREQVGEMPAETHQATDQAA